MSDDQKIVQFTGVTCADLEADQVLQSAIGQLDHVVIMGYTNEGNEYFASSMGDGGDTLWLVERFKASCLMLTRPEDLER